MDRPAISAPIYFCPLIFLPSHFFALPFFCPTSKHSKLLWLNRPEYRLLLAIVPGLNYARGQALCAVDLIIC